MRCLASQSQPNRKQYNDASNRLYVDVHANYMRIKADHHLLWIIYHYQHLWMSEAEPEKHPRGHGSLFLGAVDHTGDVIPKHLVEPLA